MIWNHYEENTRATPEELEMSGRGDDRLAEYGPIEKIVVDAVSDPFDHQVGGSHYKQFAIQPYEFFFRNNLPHHKAAIIRRIMRYDHPTGKGIIDLQKIKHEIDLIIHLQYPGERAE